MIARAWVKVVPSWVINSFKLFVLMFCALDHETNNSSVYVVNRLNSLVNLYFVCVSMEKADCFLYNTLYESYNDVKYLKFSRQQSNKGVIIFRWWSYICYCFRCSQLSSCLPSC